MSKSETFNNLTSGISGIASAAGVVAAAIWAYFVFPDLSEAKRGWPGHPTIEGCVAVRTPDELRSPEHYVEAGLSVANNTSKDVLIDSVRFEVGVGMRRPEAAKSAQYDVEDPQFVVFLPLPELAMTVKPGAQQFISGHVVRSRETKHYFRGIVINGTAHQGPYEFTVQAFVRGEADPYGFARPVWLTDHAGKCPWNAAPR